VYALDLNIADSAVFRGVIQATPLIQGTFGRIGQVAELNYALECDVVNPANIAQRRKVGRMNGRVPISPQGVYQFNAGTLKVSVDAIGRATAFESRFSGTAAGKPLVKQSEGLLTQARKEVLNIQKSFQGKTVSVAVKKYDKMVFTQHILGSGPVQVYPAVAVNGTMIYDYDRFAWYFQDVTLNYADAGQQRIDRLSGSIRWVEATNRKQSGDGEYQFDVRVNEPPPNESGVFAGAANEAAFFEVDNSIPCLAGTMKYKDTMNGESVTASSVKFDLVGSRLTKQQTMNLAKLLVFSCIVPMNAE
jgi:hypothetical protein